MESLAWLPREALDVTVEPVAGQAATGTSAAATGPGSDNTSELWIHRSRLVPGGLRLRLGETARFEWNVRTSGGCGCGGEWLYYLNVVNVYYGPYREDVFLGPPDHLSRDPRSMR